jgi:hypothetical protein
MVDRIMVDPSVHTLTESDTQTPRLMPGGLCFICGTWVDHETQDAYRVTLERVNRERQEHLAHVTCLKDVAHPSSALVKATDQHMPVTRETETRLPDAAATPEDVPADYLDPKPFTADGR